ncbi:MAG: hypothetical protein M3N31_02115, partial [Actinomycetota bacterium]|nr:hypothetical protein [Actinomycetota bacterium]
APQVVVIAVAVGVAAWRPRLRLPALSVAVIACLWAAVGGGPDVDRGTAVARGARLWRQGGATVLVVDRSRAGHLLSGLRRAEVRSVDVVAVRSASPRAVQALGPVLERHPARLVLTPATARSGTALTVGGLRVEVVATRPRLDVRVSPAGARR